MGLFHCGPRPCSTVGLALQQLGEMCDQRRGGAASAGHVHFRTGGAVAERDEARAVHLDMAARGGQHRHPQPGRGQADQRGSLASFLDDARREAGAAAQRDEMIVDARADLAEVLPLIASE